METRFAVILLCEFVGIGKVQGDPTNPKRSISFKVFPKGQSHIHGLIMGFPVLDVEPHGFGLVNLPTSWYFKGLDAYMPKAEIADRSRYKDAVVRWKQQPQIGNSGSESVRAMVEVRSSPMLEMDRVHVALACKQAGLCCVYDDSEGSID